MSRRARDATPPRTLISAHTRANIGRILADPTCDWFGAHLIRLIAKADAGNRATLAWVYPDFVQAFEEWLERDDV